MSLRLQDSDKEAQQGPQEVFDQSHFNITAVLSYWLGVVHGTVGLEADAMMDLGIQQLGPSVKYTPEFDGCIFRLAQCRHVCIFTQTYTFFHTNNYRAIALMKVSLLKYKLVTHVIMIYYNILSNIIMQNQ